MNMPRVVKSTGWKFGDVACAEEVAMLDVSMSDMKQEDGRGKLSFSPAQKYTQC